MVQKALGLAHLQEEMSNLFAQVGASPRLMTEQANWLGFLFVLLNDLCNRPIEWPNSKNKKAQIVYNRMMTARSGFGRADIYPHSLTLEHKDDGHEGRGFYYSIVIKQDGPHTATIVGLLAST